MRCNGYIGKKTGYISTEKEELCSYDSNEIKRFENVIKTILGLDIKELFILEDDEDEITKYIRDLDWKKIRIAIFNKMVTEKYFTNTALMEPQNLLEYASEYFLKNETLLPTLIDSTFSHENNAYATSIFRQCIILFPEFSQTLIKPSYFSKLLEKPTDSANTVILLLPELSLEAILEFLNMFIPEMKDKIQYKNDLQPIVIALYKAAEKNTIQLPIIAQFLLAFIQKTAPNDMAVLIKGLSEKITLGDYQGSNALYLMMHTLNWVAQKNPNQVPAITHCLLTLIDKTPSEDMPALIAALSEKKPEGNFKFVNALYCMMDALDWAARIKPRQIPAIIHCLSALIHKTPAEKIPTLIKGLSEKRGSKNRQGSNALCYMMRILNREIQPAITDCLLALIHKTPAEHIPALIEGLLAKITFFHDQSTNALYWMMRVLRRETEENSNRIIPAITHCLLALIHKTPAEHISVLITGLSEKIIPTDTQNTNAFYCMLRTLSWEAQKNPNQVPAITNCLLALIDKTPAEHIPALIAELSEKIIAGDHQDINALYCMMDALNWGVRKNSNQISVITGCLLALIHKTPAEHISALIAGLSEKSTYNQDANALYWMMRALSLEAQKNPNQMPAITNCLLALIDKTPVEHIPTLIKGLSGKRMSDCYTNTDAFTNALYLIMHALNLAVEKNSNQIAIITNCLLALIKKTPEVELSILIAELKAIPLNKDQFYFSLFNGLLGASQQDVTAKILKVCCSLKKELSSVLRDYLTKQFKSPETHIEALCDAKTYFGQLIDYHQDQNKQNKKPTKTRNFVNNTLKLKEKNTAHSSSLFNFFRFSPKVIFDQSKKKSMEMGVLK